MDLTWGDVGAFFAVLVVGSFIAGFVDTWLEQREWDKKNKKGGEFSGSKDFRSN